MQLYNPESIIENDNRKKVLIGLLGDVGFGGGLNAFLYNMLSHMDCSKFCIHIYAPGRVVSAKMADAYKELGGGNLYRWMGAGNKESSVAGLGISYRSVSL